MPSRTASPEDLLACAVETARRTAGYAAENASRRTESVCVARHDVKLRLDLECQDLAVQAIRSAFPEHAVLAEEDTEGNDRGLTDADYEWIVDPIDGTVNFSHGLRGWCTSIAVRKGPEVLAGAVYAPMLDELYAASVTQPATCNGRPIQVSGLANARLAIVMSGLDRSVPPGTRRYCVFEALTDEVQRTRVMGSAALDMCRVAAGRADAYFESGIYLWDVAAAGLIVRQAGGSAEMLEDLGGYSLRYLATNGHLHERLREVVLTALAGREG